MRFEELSIWRRSSALCVELYRYLRELKDFGFRDQITRSALSVPSNIAEGFEGDKDENGHRGTLNGWRFRGLPWQQT